MKLGEERFANGCKCFANGFIFEWTLLRLFRETLLRKSALFSPGGRPFPKSFSVAGYKIAGMLITKKMADLFQRFMAGF